MPIDLTSGEPLYLQLSAWLRDRILSGEYPPKTMLPSLRTLTEEHEVSRMTAERAVEIIRNEGLVRGIPGKGVFVLPVSERPAH